MPKNIAILPRSNCYETDFADHRRRTAIRTLLESFLEERYACVTAGNAAEARAAIAEQYFNVVLSDIDLGGETGTELVPSIIEASPETAVVMISGNRDLDDAIASIRAGAFDYVKKPFELDFLEIAVDRALQHNQLLRSKRQYETELEHLLKKRTDQVTFLSLHDSVTGLPNSVRFTCPQPKPALGSADRRDADRH